MNFRLGIAGMMAASVVFGVATGKSIDTTPRYFGEDFFSRYSQEFIAPPAAHQRVQLANLPDHYPMRTPRGEIDVYELSFYMRDRHHWTEMKRYEQLASTYSDSGWLWDGEVVGFTPEPEHFRSEPETHLAVYETSSGPSLPRAPARLVETSVEEDGVRVHRASTSPSVARIHVASAAPRQAATKPAVRMVSKPVIQPLPTP